MVNPQAISNKRRNVELHQQPFVDEMNIGPIVANLGCVVVHDICCNYTGISSPSYI